MKKIIALTLAIMLVLSLNVFADEPAYSDIFNNPLLEIVATINEEPGTPAEGAELVVKTITGDEDYTNSQTSFYESKLYSDGTYVREYICTLTDVYMMDYASNHYPEYLKGDTTGKYVVSQINMPDDGTFTAYTDQYLVDTTGEEITLTLVGSFSSDYDVETHSSIYTIYNATEENGTIVRTPAYDAPLTEAEFDKLVKGSIYEDGIKYAHHPDPDYAGVYCYSDVNDKVYFEDYGMGYFNFFYNIGYLVTSSNNGDVLDYSVDDYEKQRIYTTCIENIFTEEKCFFYDTDIITITNSGYAIVCVKDAARNETTYLAKIKKPAVTQVIVNGEKLLFDVLPTISEGRTLVPLRAIFEALGAEIQWDDATKTVTATRDALTVTLTIGSDKMNVGGVEKTLDVPAQIIDGRTLVPVRAISEAFGCNVQWDGVNSRVIINY